jgi:glyoxylase-like metal-dependent hydrolase (beta-lactamase superfamily II)
VYGDIIPIAKNTLFIEGLEPELILKEPDIASAVLHKAGDTLYIMDTGATLFFRERIKEAAERLRPFDRLVLLNSHGHPDHTPNNAVIREIAASEKKHYIARAGLPFLDYAARTRSDFDTIAQYYRIEDGPGFPFSLLTRPLKILRLIRPQLLDRSFIDFMTKSVMKKFEPLEPSRETATVFETVPPDKLPIKNAALTGWKFQDDIYVIESRGHTPDSVSFYLPKVKVLFLSDETTDYFNCWADSNAGRVTAILRTALSMYEAGEVDVLIGGHQQEAFRGEKIPALIHRLIGQHGAFIRGLSDIVQSHPEGITVKKIYRLLGKLRDLPEIDRFFRLEFPKMPGMLKTAITFALLEAGFEATGKPGKKRFFPIAGGAGSIH